MFDTRYSKSYMDYAISVFRTVSVTLLELKVREVAIPSLVTEVKNNIMLPADIKTKTSIRSLHLAFKILTKNKFVLVIKHIYLAAVLNN
ncbi:MAG: hypothetical protein WAK50_12615 [Nitrososphaeraceae archaeon]|jgi:hypothetical protein